MPIFSLFDHNKGALTHACKLGTAVTTGQRISMLAADVFGQEAVCAARPVRECFFFFFFSPRSEKLTIQFRSVLKNGGCGVRGCTLPRGGITARGGGEGGAALARGLRRAPPGGAGGPRGSCSDVSSRVAGGGSARQSGTRARTSIVRVWSAAFGWPLCPMDYGAGDHLGLRRT